MSSVNNDELKKSAFNGVAWKFAERICAQGVSLVVSIILGRMLMPDDYAVVAVVALFFSFCNLFISCGLPTALLQKKNPEPGDYSTVFYTNMVLAVTLYFLIFFAAPIIADIYDIVLLVPIFRVMGLSFFIDAYKSVLGTYTYSNLQFKKFFFPTIIGTLISAVVGITMAYKGFGVWALVAQQIIASSITSVIRWLTVRDS